MIDIQLAEADWAGVETGVQALLEKWLVPIGTPLLKGQPIASVVLVKASIDIEAPADGALASILVPDGDSFAIGQTIATFDDSPRV
jgi:pyruvate/2-oxoglutarate dehydrogenase complex dihydrolipoamide acyltransferase (E2) component